MGPEAAGVTATTPEQARDEPTMLHDWRPLSQPLALADDGRFLLDHFLGGFCNPFYRIASEHDLYDDTMDRLTGEPLSLGDFNAMASGAQAPDELRRQLGSFLAGCLVEEYEADFGHAAAGPHSTPSEVAQALSQARTIRALSPFAPQLSPELQRHLMERAARRGGREIPGSLLATAATEPLPLQLPVPRPKAEHEARFRQRIEDLRTLRVFNTRTGASRNYTVLIIGAGPAGLIRAISAALQGVKVVVLESRPEDGTRRPQIVVIRSHAVIALLEQLGVIDFLFKENQIFPLGRLKLEVSLAGLELAFQTVLRLLTADEQEQIVHHETVVERIDQDGGLARVTARKSDHQVVSFSPQLIVIADGKRSPTSALLGISRRDQFHSHTGIIAIFRNNGAGLSHVRRMMGALSSKLTYAFHRYVSRKGAALLAGTILQVPGHHYLGLDLARDEEMRLRDAIKRAEEEKALGASNTESVPERLPGNQELHRLLRFWAEYAFEAIRTHPRGSAPHTGGRPVHWLPLDPQFTMPIEVVSDRADVFGGYIGQTFVMIEGDAQFTIHPGSAYGCTKAFLSARLFDFLLRARLSQPDEKRNLLADLAFVCNAELMVRACNQITRFFRITK